MFYKNIKGGDQNIAIDSIKPSRQRLNLLLILLLICLPLQTLMAWQEGFYKDIFMDGGVELYSKTSLPAISSAGLSMEFLATEDQTLQDSLLISNAEDSNGILLYPDNAPRFRLIYTNGGSATGHGDSMGGVGREIIRNFVANGGSYSGSCAGAFISSLSYQASGSYESYYQIWPGRTAMGNVLDTYTGHFIPQNSPLLAYYSFGGDDYISHIYHTGGPYPRETLDFPSGTEILLRYDHPPSILHHKGSCWAFKAADSTGRIVVIGSHPENSSTGEGLDLTKAIFYYALDGVGSPQIKGNLVNGEPRIMDQTTEDHNPLFTRIGDKQYHHFKLPIPPGTGELTLSLDGEEGFEFRIYANPGDFAFASNAAWAATTSGSDQELTILDPDSGNWYVGVQCISTVSTTLHNWGYEYISGTEILNGATYTIQAAWTPAVVAVDERPQTHLLFSNFPNPFNGSTNFQIQLDQASDVTIDIFDNTGRHLEQLANTWKQAGTYRIHWQPDALSSGIYLARMSTLKGHQTIRVLYLK